MQDASARILEILTTRYSNMGHTAINNGVLLL